MKKLPVLRYILLGVVVHLWLYFLGVILFPIYDTFRKPIMKHKTWFLIWFLNDNEGDYVSNTYGDAGWREDIGFDYETANWLQKLWVRFRWLAIRNSHWWFRMHVLKPKQGLVYNEDIITNNTTPVTNGLQFCNYTIWGVQFGTYWVDDTKYFRYSFTKKTPWIMRIFGFNDMWNIHSGWAPGRWIFKSRWFKSNRTYKQSN